MKQLLLRTFFYVSLFLCNTISTRINAYEFNPERESSWHTEDNPTYKTELHNKKNFPKISGPLALGLWLIKTTYDKISKNNDIDIPDEQNKKQEQSDVGLSDACFERKQKKEEKRIQELQKYNKKVERHERLQLLQEIIRKHDEYHEAGFLDNPLVWFKRNLLHKSCHDLNLVPHEDLIKQVEQDKHDEAREKREEFEADMSPEQKERYKRSNHLKKLVAFNPKYMLRTSILSTHQQLCQQGMNQDDYEPLKKLKASLEREYENSNDENRKEVLQKRIDAIDETIKSGSYLFDKHYTLPPDVITFLQDQGIDPEPFTFCYGTELQQKLHEECLEHLSVAAELREQFGDELDPITQAMLAMIDSANECNQFGLVRFAQGFLDGAWAVCQISIGLVWGVAEGTVVFFGSGIYNLVHFAYNPSDAIYRTFMGVAHSIHFLTNILLDLARFETLVEQADIKGLQEFHKDSITADSINACAEHVKGQSLTRNAKDVASLAMQFYLARRTAKNIIDGFPGLRAAFGLAFEGTITKVKDLIAQASSITEAPTLLANFLTPEGALEALQGAGSAGAIALEAPFVSLMAAIQSVGQIMQTIGTETARLIAWITLLSQIPKQKNKPGVVAGTPQTPLLPNNPQRSWCDLASEIQRLRKLFDKVETFNNHPLRFDFEHIFEWKIKNGKWEGFHHDWMGELERQGKYASNVIKTTREGFYKAEIIINGRMETKTFFPKHMTRDDVAEMILDIIKTSKNNAKYSKWRKTWEIKHVISSEVEILIAIDGNGVIKTSFPIIK